MPTLSRYAPGSAGRASAIPEPRRPPTGYRPDVQVCDTSAQPIPPGRQVEGTSFAAVTPNAKSRFGSLEAGRGMAAIAIVLCHAAPFTAGNSTFIGAFICGRSGVDFFFVLSGFIIMSVHHADMNRPARLTRFLMQRFTRVMPTYWVVLALTLLLAQMHLSVMDLVRSVLLPPSDEALPVIVAWSLRYEIVFYALFALLIVNKRAGVAVFAGWAAWIVLSPAVANTPWLPRSLHAFYNIEFFLGMTAALWLRNHGVPAPRLVLTLGIGLLSLAIAGDVAGVLDYSSDLARLCYGLPSAIILLGAVEAERRRLVRVPAGFLFLGKASYSIYLFHKLWLCMAQDIWNGAGLDSTLPPIAGFLALAAAGVAGGVLMAHVVEYPLMRALRKGADRAQTWRRPHWIPIRPGVDIERPAHAGGGTTERTA